LISSSRPFTYAAREFLVELRALELELPQAGFARDALGADRLEPLAGVLDTKLRIAQLHAQPVALFDVGVDRLADLLDFRVDPAKLGLLLGRRRLALGRRRHRQTEGDSPHRKQRGAGQPSRRRLTGRAWVMAARHASIGLPGGAEAGKSSVSARLL